MLFLWKPCQATLGRNRIWTSSKTLAMVIIKKRRFKGRGWRACKPLGKGRMLPMANSFEESCRVHKASDKSLNIQLN